MPFQLGCWEMQHNPYGMSEEGEIDAITEFAHVQKLKEPFSEWCQVIASKLVWERKDNPS